MSANIYNKRPFSLSEQVEKLESKGVLRHGKDAKELLAIFEKDGLITRIAKGVYVKARKTRFGILSLRLTN